MAYVTMSERELEKLEAEAATMKEIVCFGISMGDEQDVNTLIEEDSEVLTTEKLAWI